MRIHTLIASPIGDLILISDGAALCGVHMTEAKHPPSADDLGERFDTGFEDAAGQLGEYFAGERRRFTVPVAARGTAFQHAVWHALRTIPYGRTWSYADLARAIGKPAAVRAVAAANGRNPVSIIVPCHRVIGADGGLVGYGGGLARKKYLLDMESGTRQDALFPAPAQT